MIRWLLVRHGETEWNKAELLQGHTDIALTAAGRVQASALRERLRNLKLTAAWSSDLGRASETAALILKGNAVQAVATPLLREMSFGTWEGQTWKDVCDEDSELMTQWLTVDPNFQPPEGETVNQLLDRAQAFSEQARVATPEGTILVVAHGGTIRALALQLTGLPIQYFRTLESVGSASVSIVTTDDAGGQIELWNDVSHYRGLT